MAKVRGERRNEEMKKALSAVIFEMKDPRIGALTTVTGVELTPDLKYAKARISVYDKDEAVRRGTIDALAHAERHIAYEVGQRMRIRLVPQIKFLLDDSIAYSARIADILSKLNTGEEAAEE